MRTRAERLAPIQQTHRHRDRPDLGKQLAYQANRDGVAERFPDPAVQQRMEVDLARLHHDDRRLGDSERPSSQRPSHTMPLHSTGGARPRERRDLRLGRRMKSMHRPLPAGSSCRLLGPPRTVPPGVGRNAVRHRGPAAQERLSHGGLR